jgi:hypothetical protein
MRPRRLAITLVLPIVGVCLATPASAQTNLRRPSTDDSTVSCRDVSIATNQPGWTISGGFTADGSQLRLVDALNWTVLRYSASGEPLASIEGQAKKSVRNTLPVSGKARGDEFIIQGTDGLSLVDKNFRSILKKNKPTNSNGGKVTALWAWEPVGKDDIVAFSDIEKADGSAGTAFVRFSLKNPGEFQVLNEFKPIGTANRGYYRSTYSYIASLGETAYYLSMNGGLKLFRHEKGKEKPEDVSALLPRDLGQLLRLPDWDYPSQFTAMLGDIERAPSFPVGLFGWRDPKTSRDSLYLLYRTRRGDSTNWTMYRIDPFGKLPWASTDLPVHANHVTVIPGAKNWAFIEKGPVLAYGAQNIPKMLLVPSEFLTDRLLRVNSNICN